MTIGTKSPTKIERTVGPADYSPDKNKIKTASRAVDFKCNTARVSRSPSPQLGPGTYHNTGKDFGKQLNKMTIG